MDDKVYKNYPLDNRYKVAADGTILGVRGRVMKPSTDPAGRRHVMVGHSKSQAVHIMVAMSWIENPDSLPEVNHINGICSDNRASNLEWCTKAHNMKHASENGLMKHGSNHYLSKLDELQVKVIKSLPCTFTNTQIGRYFGVDKSTIRPIRLGLTWKHICS